MMNIWKYGDDINTDMLFPGKYTYSCSTVEEILPHLLEDLDPEFSGKAAKGDILFAGKNFGCGSSREQPVVGLKAIGIKAIVAKSYARIFYRAAINQGLLLIVLPELVENYKKGDKIDISLSEGKIKLNDKYFDFEHLPDKLMEILEKKGLVNWIRDKN